MASVRGSGAGGDGRSGHRDRDYGNSRKDGMSGSRRSDYSFDRVNEWHSSKKSSGDHARGWSISDNSTKSKTIRSAAAQNASIRIGGQSVDPYSSTLQDVSNTAQRPGPTTFSPGASQDVPTSADALSDFTTMYTAQAKEEMTKDALNIAGPFGSAAQGVGLLEREPDVLSKRGQSAQKALRSQAESEVSKRDNLTGSKLGDNVMSAAASFVVGPIGGMAARGAIAAGSAANISDSPYYDGEPIKHQGVGDYGEGQSSKSGNTTKLILKESLKGKGDSTPTIKTPERDNSIGIGTGGLAGRLSDFSGSLAIKPKRNGRRGRI